ncbi:hypothetical protein T08_2111 [Trichinella sp. T8]|nr:hypothetical protein T08_2111 [Trichinella sp. T8]
MTGRDKKHVVMKLILPAIDEIPAKSPMLMSMDELNSIKAGGSSQNPRLFSRGKDMSVAPTITGISQFPNPLSSIGITIKKIMKIQDSLPRAHSSIRLIMKKILPFTPLDIVNVDVWYSMYCTVMNMILNISVSSSQFNGLPSGTPKGLGMFSEVGGHVPCSGISADLKNIQKNNVLVGISRIARIISKMEGVDVSGVGLDQSRLDIAI